MRSSGPVANNYILDAEFPGSGIRFHGDLPPVVPGPCFNIRKRPPRIISLAEYVAAGIMTEAQRQAITGAVHARRNILVVGGTKTGKTTLTNVIIDEFVGSEQRVATTENVLELQIRAKEWHSYRRNFNYASHSHLGAGNKLAIRVIVYFQGVTTMLTITPSHQQTTNAKRQTWPLMSAGDVSSSHEGLV